MAHSADRTICPFRLILARSWAHFGRKRRQTGCKEMPLTRHEISPAAMSAHPGGLLRSMPSILRPRPAILKTNPEILYIFRNFSGITFNKGKLSPCLILGVGPKAHFWCGQGQENLLSLSTLPDSRCCPSGSLYILQILIYQDKTLNDFAPFVPNDAVSAPVATRKWYKTLLVSPCASS